MEDYYEECLEFDDGGLEGLYIIVNALIFFLSENTISGVYTSFAAFIYLGETNVWRTTVNLS